MLNWQSQMELCKAIWEEPSVARELVGVVREDTLSQPLGWIALACTDLHQRHRSVPTEGLLREWLTEKVSGVLLETALERLVDVSAAPRPPEGWAVQTGRRLAAEGLLRGLVAEMPGLASEGRFDDVLHRVRQAALLASPQGELTRGAGSQEEVTERQHEVGERVPTGIHRLDQYLNGGLKRGEMGHVLGRKGGGKSHALVHLGAEALKRNRAVLHATLEMSAKEVRARYDRHLVQASGREFFDKIGSFMPILEDHHERLSVLVRKGLSLGALSSAIQRASPRPDVVVVDYLQLMHTSGLTGDGDMSAMRRRALGQLSQDLHDLAQEADVALWTAYQTNRTGMMAVNQNGVLDITHYAEAIDAAWPAAVVMSLNQTIDEAINKEGRIFLAENRGGEKLRTIEASLRWDISYLRDLQDPCEPK